MAMRIGLNLLPAMPETGGSWNYIARLVAALGEHDRRNEYVAFVTGRSAELAPRRENFTIVPIAIDPVSRLRRIGFENARLPRLARRLRLDVLHGFANTLPLANPVPGVVTIYDLIVLQSPRSFSPAQRLYLRAMLPHTVRRAACLLPMSESTAGALRSLLHAPAERMRVIPAIVGDRFRPAPPGRVEELRRRLGLPGAFWLYVAHFYRHKNHLRLLQAYRGLKAGGHAPWPLVLRGRDCGVGAEARRLVREWGLERDVLFLPALSEEDLAVLYAAAGALVFPSLHEGGGMPVVEAMACGCPILASGIPVVREFAGDAAAYFAADDAGAIAGAMASFQAAGGERERLGRAGLARAEAYRAARVVPALLEAYSLARSG